MQNIDVQPLFADSKCIIPKLVREDILTCFFISPWETQFSLSLPDSWIRSTHKIRARDSITLRSVRRDLSRDSNRKSQCWETHASLLLLAWCGDCHWNKAQYWDLQRELSGPRYNSISVADKVEMVAANPGQILLPAWWKSWQVE